MKLFYLIEDPFDQSSSESQWLTYVYPIHIRKPDDLLWLLQSISALSLRASDYRPNSMMDKLKIFHDILHKTMAGNSCISIFVVKVDF